MKKFRCLGGGLIVLIGLLTPVLLLNNQLNRHSSSNDPFVSDNQVTSITEISGSLVPYKYEDLLEKSSLVVRGEFVDQSDPFRIIPVYGGEGSNFTDFYLEVNEVLRGKGESNDIVTVRVEGGVVDGHQVIAHEEPCFSIGDEVLLFLSKPNMGSGYNTEGDYYYVLGAHQGAFYYELKEGRTRSSISEETFVEENGNMELSWTEVSKEIVEYDQKNPVDEDLIYNDLIASLKANVISGFITQEEYNDYLSQTKQFATIIR